MSLIESLIVLLTIVFCFNFCSIRSSLSELCEQKARSIGAESRFRLKCEVKINEKWIDIQEVKLPL